MATSRISSNSPDAIDVASVMEAFETINKVNIVLIGRVAVVSGSHCLRFLVEAHSKETEIGEAPSLASVNAYLGYGGHKTMEGAIMWALYQLDWQLAEAELRKASKTA